MKMEKKHCTKCKHFLLFECFKNKKTSELTKCCVKCLDNCNNSRQQSKCKHGRQRSQCKDCGGSQICERNRKKSTCKNCGRSQTCERNKIRSQFKDCVGGGICGHNRIKSQCKDCDLPGHLAGVLRHRIYAALKIDKEMSSTEYLGCNIETFKKHIERQLIEDMSWKNCSEWHIDHKIPLKYKKPSLEEAAQRLHYTNTQPMWASETMSKSCRYISDLP